MKKIALLSSICVIAILSLSFRGKNVQEVVELVGDDASTALVGEVELNEKLNLILDGSDVELAEVNLEGVETGPKVTICPGKGVKCVVVITYDNPTENIRVIDSKKKGQKDVLITAN